MAKMSRYALYKAVKHQVNEYHADCGFTLSEMWELVNSNTDDGMWWKDVCVADYSRDIMGWDYGMIIKAQQYAR